MSRQPHHILTEKTGSTDRRMTKLPASHTHSASRSAPRPRLKAGWLERMAAMGVFVVISAAVAFGWLSRHEAWIDPRHGIGYALGIIGSVMMLVLLAYPLRKRMRTPRWPIGTVGFWFRFHMLLGLFGPLAILYHSRFTWGALNSAFAMGSMIVVASSGLVGRYFYAKVHRGYSDRKLEVRTLRRDMEQLVAGMERAGLSHENAAGVLQPFEARAVAAGSAFWSSAAAVLTLGWQTRRAASGLRHSLAGYDQATARTLRAGINDYFEAVRRAAEFAFYDRLLRLWHLLHLPLFFVLVAAAILHVIAVNMY